MNLHGSGECVILLATGRVHILNCSFLCDVCAHCSSKFSSKIRYVNSLAELEELIPMDYVHIPESIIK